jgi:Peptidase A4 family
VIGGAPPVAATAAGTPAGGRNLPAPVGPHVLARPITGTQQVGSYNWSGYAQNAGVGAATFHAVKDTWTVPTVNTSLPGFQFSSDWVGIGGLFDGTLVQAGTEADNIEGAPVYRAWTEILPEAENPLSLEVHPGDKITTTVREIKPGVWKMIVADKTTKQKALRKASYSGSSHGSVEAIHERPCIFAPCNAIEDLAELTDTTNVTFDKGAYATALGEAPKTPLLNLATGATLYQIFMLNNEGTEIIASPSEPDTDKNGSDGFSLAYGPVQPPPPKS